MRNHQPLSLEHLRSKQAPIRNPHREHQQKMSMADTIALAITNRVGTIGFFGIILTWSVLWITWNSLAPSNLRFDPFPGFVLWLFISNLIQIMLMPLIMVGQNVQSRVDSIQSQADYEVNIKAEEEIEVIIQHLENHEHSLAEIKALLQEITKNSR